MPKDLDIYLVVDNYAIHKSPKGESMARETTLVSRALHANQFVLVDSSGALVGTDNTTSDLTPRINAFVDRHNQDSESFKWIATADTKLYLGQDTR